MKIIDQDSESKKTGKKGFKNIVIRVILLVILVIFLVYYFIITPFLEFEKASFERNSRRIFEDYGSHFASSQFKYFHQNGTYTSDLNDLVLPDTDLVEADIAGADNKCFKAIIKSTTFLDEYYVIDCETIYHDKSHLSSQ